MFIGHLAVGFAAKRAAPRASLGGLMAAPLLLDLLWPFFLLLGLEQVRIRPSGPPFLTLAFERYPYTHSLLMAGFWSGVFALLYLAITKYRAGAWCVGLGVFSHWVMDFITHEPDLQLAPGIATRVGLGLWRSPAGTILVEGLLFVAALWTYLRGTRARDRAGSLGLWSFVATVVLLYVLSIAGPPPPNTRALAYTGLALWVILPWTAWFDRHREPRLASG